MLGVSTKSAGKKTVDKRSSQKNKKVLVDAAKQDNPVMYIFLIIIAGFLIACAILVFRYRLRKQEA